MKIDEPLENWTKFPNCILDNLDVFDNEEFKILGLMVRKNLGYQNPNHEFSARYISVKTGMSKPTVLKRLAKLLDKGSIQIIGIGKRGIHKYGINWTRPLTREAVNPVNRSTGLTATGKPALPLPVNGVDQVKENSSIRNHSKRQAELVIRVWNKYNGSRIRLTKTRESKIKSTLLEYSLREILYSCINLQKDDWYSRDESAKKYHGLQRLIDPKKRDNNLDRFSFFPWVKQKPQSIADISAEVAIERARETAGRW